MATQNEIKDLPKLSVYRYENFFNIYTDDKSDMRFYNLLRNINVFSANNTVLEDEYLIQYDDSWTYISYKAYNTTELWWLICAYNQIQNPIKMPQAGTKIKILKSEYVNLVLTELNKQLKT